MEREPPVLFFGVDTWLLALAVAAVMLVATGTGLVLGRVIARRAEERGRGREPARAGSAEGLGRATAWTLLDSGRDIVVHARSRERLAVVGEPSGPGSLARGVLARITCEGAC
jgi:Ribosomal silencing factor during starvation